MILQAAEANFGDVDLFMMSEDRARLVVNDQWLQHLQVILHHQPVLLVSHAL